MKIRSNRFLPLLGYWGALAEERSRVWRDHWKAETVWLAGCCLAQTHQHGQWLLSYCPHKTRYFRPPERYGVLCI